MVFYVVTIYIYRLVISRSVLICQTLEPSLTAYIPFGCYLKNESQNRDSALIRVRQVLNNIFVGYCSMIMMPKL